MDTATSEENASSSDVVPNGEHVVRLVELGGAAVGHLRLVNYVQGLCATITVLVPAITLDTGVTIPMQHAQVSIGPKEIAKLVKALTDPLRMEEAS